MTKTRTHWLRQKPIVGSSGNQGEFIDTHRDHLRRRILTGLDGNFEILHATVQHFGKLASEAGDKAVVEAEIVRKDPTKGPIILDSKGAPAKDTPSVAPAKDGGSIAPAKEAE